MKKLFTRCLTLALVTVMMFTCLPITAVADVGDYSITEVEPNDSFDLADVVYNDYTVSGRCGYYDVDYFKLYVSTGSTVRVLIVGDNSYLYLGLKDSTDTTLAATKTSYSGGRYAAQLSHRVSAGTYYIGLVNESGYANTYAFYVEVTPNSTHTHSYSSRVTPPTCTSRGYTTYVCSCGHSYDGNYISAKGHTYDDSNDADCNVCGFDRTVKNGWIQEGAKWAYYKNGVKVTNSWMKDSVGWCYLGADGYMLTNSWMKDSVGWCYIGSNGYCVTNSWQKDSKGWCYLNANGSMVKNGWVLDGGKWYYLDGNGYMISSQWRKDSKGWCYLTANGSMATNQWIKDSVGWCFVGANGYCVTNSWQKDSKGWCYLDANGRMKTNSWVKDSKGWCYVGANGYCVTNSWMKDSTGWCYLDSNGRMVTDTWERDSNGWCYINQNGYVQRHSKDYCNHRFAAATYSERSTCSSCGAERGEVLSLPISFQGTAPFYTWANGYNQAKLSNFYYRVTSTNTLRLYFDVQAVVRNGSIYDYYGATFKLFDSEGHLIDDANWVDDSLSVGETSYGEYVYLDLDNWNGFGTLTLVVEDYR